MLITPFFFLGTVIWLTFRDASWEQARWYLLTAALALVYDVIRVFT